MAENGGTKSEFKMELESPPPKKDKGNMCTSSLKENALTLATFVGVLVGIGLGVGLKESREEGWYKREAELYVGFLGQLFLNMLKCIIIPLVIPSLITAIGPLMTP